MASSLTSVRGLHGSLSHLPFLLFSPAVVVGLSVFFVLCTFSSFSLVLDVWLVSYSLSCTVSFPSRPVADPFSSSCLDYWTRPLIHAPQLLLVFR